MNPTDFGDLLSLYSIFWSYIYIINSRNDITQLQLYELTQNMIQAFTVSLVDILIILISMHFFSSVSHMDSHLCHLSMCVLDVSTLMSASAASHYQQHGWQ